MQSENIASVTSEPTVPGSPMPPIAIQLRDAVKDLLKDLNGQGEVKNRVINQLVEAELVKRTDILSRAIAKREELSKAIEKIQPETTYSLDGKEVNRVYTKAKLDERNKAQAKLDKMDKAIEKACIHADYDEVRKLCEQNNDAKQGGDNKDTNKEE